MVSCHRGSDTILLFFPSSLLQDGRSLLSAPLKAAPGRLALFTFLRSCDSGSSQDPPVNLLCAHSQPAGVQGDKYHGGYTCYRRLNSLSGAPASCLLPADVLALITVSCHTSAAVYLKYPT